MNLMWFVEKFYNRKPKFRRLMMKLLFGDKTISITLFDTELVIHSIKENGYYRASQLCQTSSLLRDEVSALLGIAGILADGDTLVDVGANIGIFSAILARYQTLFSKLNIYAFEVNTDTYQRLKNNAIRHHFNAYQVGISDQECELEFVEGVVSHVFTTRENETEYNIKDKIIKLKCQRLDQFMIEGDSIILKIDVEGQELQVLKGASSLFDEKRIKAVYLDGFLNQGVLDFLRAYNFSLWDGRKLVPTDGQVFSLLAILPEKLPNQITLGSASLVRY